MSAKSITGISELDRMLLADVMAQHPRAAVRVAGGFLDGSEAREFGCVPDDWDGSTVVCTDFRRRGV